LETLITSLSKDKEPSTVSGISVIGDSSILMKLQTINGGFYHYESKTKLTLTGGLFLFMAKVKHYPLDPELKEQIVNFMSSPDSRNLLVAREFFKGTKAQFLRLFYSEFSKLEHSKFEYFRYKKDEQLIPKPEQTTKVEWGMRSRQWDDKHPYRYYRRFIREFGPVKVVEYEYASYNIAPFTLSVYVEGKQVYGSNHKQARVRKTDILNRLSLILDRNQ
jgi:hypothetical protein